MLILLTERSSIVLNNLSGRLLVSSSLLLGLFKIRRHQKYESFSLSLEIIRHRRQNQTHCHRFSVFGNAPRYCPNIWSDIFLPWLGGGADVVSSSFFLSVRPQPILSTGTTGSPILNLGVILSARIVFCHSSRSWCGSIPGLKAKLALVSGTVCPPRGVCVK